ncbi:MAG: type IV pili twitching motility protein PilT, partial [Alphaproteobacteria bacterium]
NPAGMVVFDQSLIRLYTEGMISEQTAIAEADIPADMKMKIQNIKIGSTSKGAANIDTSKLSL